MPETKTLRKSKQTFIVMSLASTVFYFPASLYLTERFQKIIPAGSAISRSVKVTISIVQDILMSFVTLGSLFYSCPVFSVF